MGKISWEEGKENGTKGEENEKEKGRRYFWCFSSAV